MVAAVAVGRGSGVLVARCTPGTLPWETQRLGGSSQVESIWLRPASSVWVTVSSQVLLMVIRSMAYWHQ